MLTLVTFLAAAAGLLSAFILSLGMIGGGLVLVGRGWGRWSYYRKLSPPNQSENGA